jgi:hypothetical protein
VQAEEPLTSHIARDLCNEWFRTCEWRGGWDTASTQQRETFVIQAKTAITSAKAFKAQQKVPTT